MHELLTPPDAAGRETLLDEDLTDKQIEEELAPVTLQLAYATAQLGDPAEALSTYKVTGHGQTFYCKQGLQAQGICKNYLGQLPANCLESQVLTTYG